jgi:hypothetical protein
MSDPKQYFLEPEDLNSPIAYRGGWIKYADFEDYKAGQRRNKNAEAITRLGVEVAELRCRIAELEAELKGVQS